MYIHLKNKSTKVRETNNVRQYKDKALKSDVLRTQICRIACRPKLKLKLFRFGDFIGSISKAKIHKIVNNQRDIPQLPK